MIASDRNGSSLVYAACNHLFDVAESASPNVCRNLDVFSAFGADRYVLNFSDDHLPSRLCWASGRLHGIVFPPVFDFGIAAWCR